MEIAKCARWFEFRRNKTRETVLVVRMGNQRCGREEISLRIGA